LATFGAFLVSHRYLDAAELEEVTQATVLRGGRLGTAVVEGGLLTPEQLDEALAAHHGLPPIPKVWFTHLEAAARARLTVDLIQRRQAFPLRLEKRTLHVGMVDPRNDAVIEEIAFASGCKIAVYALSELRFVELMQRAFGVKPPPRFAALLDTKQLGRIAKRRADQLAARKRVLGSAAPGASAPGASAAATIGPLDEDMDLVDERTFARMLAQQAAELPSFAPDPSGAAALQHHESVLRDTRDRNAVVDATLALAGAFVELAALFVMRDGVAAGLSATRGGQRFGIESILAPLSGGSLLAEAVRRRGAVRGVPEANLDRMLARALRCGPNAELAVFPVVIGDRVAQLILAQGGAGLAETGIAALAALTPLVAAAYQRLIRGHQQGAGLSP
jgi:hypothetical protein